MRPSISRAATAIVVGLVVACTSATSPAPISLSPTAAPAVTSPRPTPSSTPSPTPTAIPANIAPGTWIATGTMITPRNSHTATLLRDGTVLVAGGISGDLVAQAELYDPGSGSWAATGSMDGGRYGHTATLLPNGKVLVAGGFRDGSEDPVASAALYDPTNGVWTDTGTMGEGRTLHTATLLADGTLLVAGGSNSASGGGALASAEVYDPGTGTWTATGTMIEARYGHTATVLLDGTVLVAGGVPNDAEHVSPINEALASAELHQPDLDSWDAIPSMATGRAKHTATLLPDGRVLVARLGQSGSAELYDPGSRSWTATGNMEAVRFVRTATLLSDGRVLRTGCRPLGSTTRGRVRRRPDEENRLGPGRLRRCRSPGSSPCRYVGPRARDRDVDGSPAGRHSPGSLLLGGHPRSGAGSRRPLRRRPRSRPLPGGHVALRPRRERVVGGSLKDQVRQVRPEPANARGQRSARGRYGRWCSPT